MLMGIVTVSLYYSLASKLKFYYTDIKNNFSDDNKYLAVVTDSGLWLKDEVNNSTLIVKANYIKDNALAWAVYYEDEKIIDSINIRNATLSAMHRSIQNIISTLKQNEQICNEFYLLVDGNDFKPYTYINEDQIEHCSHVTIKGGDNLYTSIAAASILAKVSRDEFITKLCEEHPDLQERYGIASNKGYGAKRHMDGIREYGITEWHRKTYGICKTYVKD